MNLDLIESERLVLSGWRREEVEDVFRLHSDPAISRYFSVGGEPWTMEKCAARLDEWIEQFESSRMGKLRVRRKADNQLVGRAGFGFHSPTGEPEIGYALFTEFHGNGYASEAARGLRDWFFAETDHNHFIGFAHVDNAPSIRILKGLGMSETGTGDFHGMPCLFHRLDRPE